ncbi:HNH endonuclease signature motif containing protein [Gracilibacillus suaedae]|uniref:HNH endonuclease signature motif containing protein n=1 Tax=Gracilibacillus suaedae TaxID=2820273 RepID=UPI001ABEAFA5|nr:HNH endonuclease signature motif containing protein [Gracilibacillus suaedae]
MEKVHTTEEYISIDKQGNIKSGEIKSQEQLDRIETQSTSLVTISAAMFAGNGQVAQGVEVTEVVGTKPATLSVSQNLCSSRDVREDFTCDKRMSKTWTTAQIYVGQNVMAYYDVNQTLFWEYNGNGVATWAGNPPTVKTTTWVEGTFLTNSKGVWYPSYVDEQSGKTLLAPASAEYKKVPVDQRVKWGPTERKIYKTWYEAQYGIRSWDNIEIHHIIPRAYGGSNDPANLIPLPKSFHRGTVTPWWTNY